MFSLDPRTIRTNFENLMICPTYRFSWSEPSYQSEYNMIFQKNWPWLMSISSDPVIFFSEGYDASWNAAAQMMMYDPDAATWASSYPLTQGRGDAATAIASGVAFALGGFHHSNWSYPMSHLEAGERVTKRLKCVPKWGSKRTHTHKHFNDTQCLYCS